MTKKFPLKQKKNKLSMFFDYLIKKLKKNFRKLKKFISKYPLLIDFFELSFLYFYVVIILIFTIRNYIGSFPPSLIQMFPFIIKMLNMPMLKFIASPEKTFLIYLIISELVLNRDVTTILVKYNLLLLLILEMLQNLIISTWDLFLHRELQMFRDNLIVSNAVINSFFTFFFFAILSLYLYCYLTALMLKFVEFPGPFKKITDSVAFWLNLKKIDQGKIKKRK